MIAFVSMLVGVGLIHNSLSWHLGTLL